MSDIEQTLAERNRYSPAFIELAKMSQSLKRTMRTAPNWPTLPADVKEALEMIQLKVARILIGDDPEYLDSWTDVEGYSRLVRERIEGDARATR
jgi:hypothetical protein